MLTRGSNNQAFFTLAARDGVKRGKEHSIIMTKTLLIVQLR